MLDALARALLLDPDESAHLHLLATGSIPGEAGDPAGCGVVTAEHLDLLARWDGIPACIQTAKFDILASNATYRFLIGDIDDGPSRTAAVWCTRSSTLPGSRPMTTGKRPPGAW